MLILKRIGSVFAIVVAGLVVAAGTAMAAPIYAPPGLSAVYIGNNQIVITGTNYGDESGPDETVAITVGYGSPSGLRSSAGLAAAAAAATTFTVNPDGDGNFSATSTLTQRGEVWVRAIGVQSGDDLTVTLVVPAQSGTGSTGGGGANQNYSSGYAGGGNVSSGYAGLASTGASIGAPLAIGIVALLAGLTLLFFGTRGVLRRKDAKSSVPS